MNRKDQPLRFFGLDLLAAAVPHLKRWPNNFAAISTTSF